MSDVFDPDYIALQQVVFGVCLYEVLLVDEFAGDLDLVNALTAIPVTQEDWYCLRVLQIHTEPVIEPGWLLDTCDSGGKPRLWLLVSEYFKEALLVVVSKWTADYLCSARVLSLLNLV